MTGAMSDRHSTTTIARPRPVVDGDGTRTPSQGRRRIPRYKQLARGRWKRIGVAFGATVVAAAITAALFVLPVQAWFSQADETSEKRRQLDVINSANAQLEAEINRLNTDDGVRDAARRELGYTGQGEQRWTVLPAPAAPLTLPVGWPYDSVSQIIAVRTGGTVIPSPAGAVVTTIPGSAPVVEAPTPDALPGSGGALP
jgi:cell division protein FtsB